MKKTDDSNLTQESQSRSILRLTYVLSYRAPNYIRTESLLSALRSCVGVRLSIARNSHKGLRRYVETWKALRALRTTETDVYLLGFRGLEIFWPVRWLCRGKPLILDALMSPYAALRDERIGSWIHRCIAALIYPFERNALRRADLVLTDTQLHANFLARTFGLPQGHFCAVPVGAIETAPAPEPESTELENKPVVNVLFYGSFLPLHGIEVILEAASKLVDLPIRFDFVGGDATQARRLRRSCKSLGVTNFTYRRWIPFEQLMQVDIPLADLCLGGPFGGTPQARRVITGKTSQCLALGKVTVIGRIDEDYGLVDRVNCLLVDQADANALAENIRWACDNRALLHEIGAAGRATYIKHLSNSVIAARLVSALQHAKALQERK